MDVKANVGGAVVTPSKHAPVSFVVNNRMRMDGVIDNCLSSVSTSCRDALTELSETDAESRQSTSARVYSV